MRSRSQPAYRPQMSLSRRQKVAIYGVCAALWGSGALWLVFDYFLQRTGPFGPEPNPAEHWLIVLHGATAFVALWMGGWLWGAHITPWWHRQKRRNSGKVLIGFGALLIVSGWLLYYAGDDALRRYTAITHWLLGLAFVVPFLVHGLRSARHRSRRNDLQHHECAGAVDDDAVAAHGRQQEHEFPGLDRTRTP